ncbi:MAG: heat-inducible transcriptional repressor HrcA [Oscillospiraceae bacterium]
MDKRASDILSAIIDEYIRTGEPVGSKALAEKHDFGVSSATIRNTMAALEQEGYLGHPHTSAGRVPTYKGFRYYVENLMNPEPVDPELISEIDSLLDSGAVSDDAIVQSASSALAEITKCATIATNHSSKFSVITKVDVIPTGKRMYVLLMITSNGSIKNKVCRMEYDLTNEQTADFTRFLNEHLSGINLGNMSEEYIEKLSEAMSGYMLAMSPLLHAVFELSEEMMRDNVEVRGEANLLSCPEFPMNEIVNFIEHKSELSGLLDSAFSGIDIRFGSEDGTFAISNGAMVSVSYYKDGKPAGTLGVVGPMRLDYRKVIPYMEYLSQKVTRLLSEEVSPKAITSGIEREEDDEDDK